MNAMDSHSRTCQRRIGRILLPLAALSIGVVLVAAFVALRQGPARVDTVQPATAVRFVEARALPFVVQARGFGEVGPARRWLAVANVEGKLMQRHARLETGAIVPAGTLLAEIDPGRYRLAIAEADADAAALRAELAQLAQDADNTRELLALERQRLTLAEAELARIRKLAAGGTVTASRADEQLRSTLAQRQAVKSLESRLLLVPSQTGRIEAQLERVAARLEQAKRDLADTRIVAPFDLRVDEVRIEQDQHIGRGQVMLAGDAIDAAEVVLQVPLDAMRALLASLAPAQAAHTADTTDAARAAYADIGAATRTPAPRPGPEHVPAPVPGPDDRSEAPPETGPDVRPVPDATSLADHAYLPELAHFPELAALEAELRLVSDRTVRWPAHVARTASRVDPVTRTVQVVLTVAEPYRSAAPPQRPPLVAGMYVEGILSATAGTPRIVLPAAALHDSGLYLIDAHERLARRTVATALRQRDVVVLEAGVAPGERVILDDLVPAIPGTALAPHHDTAAQARLARVASGAAP
jgi:multidrug efflux pump subunit AcrA (membrane-fusion protein)